MDTDKVFFLILIVFILVSSAAVSYHKRKTQQHLNPLVTKGLVVLGVIAAAGIIALTVFTGGFDLAVMAGASAAVGAGTALSALGEIGALWSFVQQSSNTSAACGGQSY